MRWRVEIYQTRYASRICTNLLSFLGKMVINRTSTKTSLHPSSYSYKPSVVMNWIRMTWIHSIAAFPIVIVFLSQHLYAAWHSVCLTSFDNGCKKWITLSEICFNKTLIKMLHRSSWQYSTELRSVTKVLSSTTALSRPTDDTTRQSAY